VKLLNRDLPENVNLLTLEPRFDGQFLLRLEHNTFHEATSKTNQSHQALVHLKVYILFISSFLCGKLMAKYLNCLINIMCI